MSRTGHPLEVDGIADNKVELKPVELARKFATFIIRTVYGQVRWLSRISLESGVWQR